MNVYIETNFTLEQTYLQEQHEWCERILALAETERVRLIMPSFCIGEAYGALVGRNKRRLELYDKLTRELKELARSKPYNSAREEFFEITRLLSTSGREEKNRLDAAVLRIVNAATLIAINQEIVKKAMELQSTRDLDPQDSLVYAAILSHLASDRSRPAHFITKNAKDFSNPDIEKDLQDLECSLFPGFGEAYGFLLKTADAIDEGP
jgi:predicted nucleic acid-binding protein